MLTRWSHQRKALLWQAKRRKNDRRDADDFRSRGDRVFCSCRLACLLRRVVASKEGVIDDSIHSDVRARGDHGRPLRGDGVVAGQVAMTEQRYAPIGRVATDMPFFISK